MLREMADAFIEQNADKGNVTIEIGVQSESSAKDTVLATRSLPQTFLPLPMTS